MDMGLKDAVVLVTGSSAGIGRAAAVAYGAEGAKVAVTYHSKREGAEETARRVEAAGGEALISRFDLEDGDSVRATIESIRQQWGALPVLVNNAVGASVAPNRETKFEDVPTDEWQGVINRALEGTYATIQAALPLMRASGWGRIVNVSSDGAIKGVAGLAPYSSAKAGLSGLTITLATELGPANILTNIVMPGYVATEENQQIPQQHLDMLLKMTPSGHLTTPEDVAGLILFLGSRANANVNGQTVLISGGR